MIQSDGTFLVRNAPLGKCRVSINVDLQYDLQKLYQIFPAKYRTPARSGLTVDVPDDGITGIGFEIQ